MSENLIDIYSAYVIQIERHDVSHRKEIRKNLNRYLQILETIKGYTRKSSFNDRYAPPKLVVFPEFFLQGWSVKFNLKKMLEDICIEIPGKEISPLCEKAKELEIYIHGCALEYDPKWPDRFLNCAFIIGPDGHIIHKYHKIAPALGIELALSPHDMFDTYVERFGRGRSLLQTFFPVTETPIGKLGTLSANDGYWPEYWRALAMNGAEVVIHCSCVEPSVSPPNERWELVNRANATTNLVYVVAANAGSTIAPEHVKSIGGGRSMIVDYEGVILAHIPYVGEAMTCATIRIDHLRRRRKDPSWNFPTQLRTEVIREIYNESIYPQNKFLKEPVHGWNEIHRRSSRAVVQSFLEKGIFTKPIGDVREEKRNNRTRSTKINKKGGKK